MSNELQKRKKDELSAGQSSPTPADLLQAAIEKGLDITQLERLMDMQERYEKKQAAKLFLEARSKFQSLVPRISKNKTANVRARDGGQGFTYTHSDLGNIAEQIKKALLACGLSYRWEFNDQGNEIEVTCIVSHLSGHSEATKMKAGLDNSGAKNLIQQKGSTLTYLQRYTLIGALGLSTADIDDDGAASSGNPVVKKQQKKPIDNTTDEALDQWKETVKSIGTVQELTRLYLRNKKAVDDYPEVKKIFKDRETIIKASLTKTELL